MHVNHRAKKAVEFLARFMATSRERNNEPALSLISTDLKIPAWVRTRAQLWQFEFVEETVTLIVPDADFDFEESCQAVRAVERAGYLGVMLLTDELPSRMRGRLIRNRIPHLTPGTGVFAPFLGVAYKKVPRMEFAGKAQQDRIMPLGLKLIAACLLDDSLARGALHPTRLAAELQRKGLFSSTSKVDRVLMQLERAGFMRTQGRPPQKAYSFEESPAVWNRLVRAEIQTVLRRVAGREPPPDGSGWVYASDSALARLTELSEPLVPVIAMSLRGFRAWQEGRPVGTLAGDAENAGVVIELWKEDPGFLSARQCLNPVELALSLRRTDDPRVRVAIGELLIPLGLDARFLWEPRG